VSKVGQDHSGLSKHLSIKKKPSSEEREGEQRQLPVQGKGAKEVLKSFRAHPNESIVSRGLACRGGEGVLPPAEVSIIYVGPGGAITCDYDQCVLHKQKTKRRGLEKTSSSSPRVLAGRRNARMKGRSLHASMQTADAGRKGKKTIYS